MKKISNELSVANTTVKAWIKIYCLKGAMGLCPKGKNTAYPKDVKIVDVEEYLAGNGSLWDISL